jgi:DNA polymerase-1
VHPVYGPSSDDDGRVGAISGRFAVKKPEVQQIPRDPRKDRYGLRRAFIPQRPGHVILGSDQTALEVVVSAHVQNRLFGLTDMVEAVMPGAPDIHSVHALGVFRDVLGHTYLEGVTPATLKKHPDPRVTSCRELIKAVFYGLAYGKEEYGFGNTLFDFEGNSLGEDRAREMLHGLFTLRPGIPLYKDWVREFIAENRGISSLSGRWCDLTELLGKAEEELRRSRRFTELWETWAFKKAWRRALNFPMQAGAADIMGAALVAVHLDPILRAMGFFPILQVHDEILLEGPEENAEEASERFLSLMTGAWPTLRAPLQATSKWGGSWYECK